MWIHRPGTYPGRRPRRWRWWGWPTAGQSASRTGSDPTCSSSLHNKYTFLLLLCCRIVVVVPPPPGVWRAPLLHPAIYHCWATAPALLRYIPSLLSYTPNLLSYIPSLLSYTPNLLSYIPSLLGCTLTLLSYIPSLLSYTPSLLSYIPSLLGCTLTLLNYIPSLLSYTPRLLLSYIPSRLSFTPTVQVHTSLTCCSRFRWFNQPIFPFPSSILHSLNCDQWRVLPPPILPPPTHLLLVKPSPLLLAVNYSVLTGVHVGYSISTR